LLTAQAFADAAASGYAPKRSLLFLAVCAEEKGLLGSKYYAENPIFPIENTVAALNMDMIGRIDDIHLDGNHNYVHAIGANMLSSDLHAINVAANEKYTKMELDERYNDLNDPQRLYYRSDHYNFAKLGVPSIFYFSGLHPHYHTPEDTLDKINFEMLVKRTKLVFHTAWELANRAERIVVDKEVR
jgi:Zn-dependent M28 family amino/carboxypeptidase